MSPPSVLTGPDLARLAATIRSRHEEQDYGCTCMCDSLDADPGPTPPSAVLMDIRERKWAAQKLLRPIGPEDAAEDFTDEEWLGIYQQVWKMRTSSRDGPTDAIDRYRVMAAQLHHTKRFAHRAWALQPKGGDDNGDDAYGANKTEV